jgi:Holliday junction resolvase RusA-like endonuclease
METAVNIVKVVCPLYIDLPRKTKKAKRVYINLNTYRNLHYVISNQVKKAYLEAVREQLEGVTIDTPVTVTYKVFKQSARKLDKLNVISITAKFLMDAVTQLGCWEDDNDDIIKTETILPTEIDRVNPRVEVIIKNINYEGV